jgi:hypothetical protein
VAFLFPRVLPWAKFFYAFGVTAWLYHTAIDLLLPQHFKLNSYDQFKGTANKIIRGQAMNS